MSTRWVRVVLLAGIAFGISVPTGGAERAPANREFAKELVAALEIGFRPGVKNAEAAAEKLDRLAQQTPDEPRIQFAAGLIWLKQIQSRKGEEAFENAVRSPGAAYWPAWRGWIWVAGRARAIPAVVERIDALVDNVREQPDAAGAGDQVEWCGRVLAALGRLEKSPATLKLLRTAEEQLRAKLEPVLAERFEAGHAELQRAFENELEKAAGTAAKLREQTQASAAVKESQLDDTLQKAAAVKEDSLKSQQQWKNWLDEQLQALEKQLAGLEKDFAYLSQRRASVLESMTTLQREITQLEFNRDSRSTRPTVVQALQRQIDERGLQLQAYQVELTATEEQMLRTIAAGSATMASRAEVVARYEKATGQLAEKQVRADQWAERLAAKKSRVKANVAKAEKQPAATSRISFVTLVPFDVAEQRRALEQDLGVQR